MSEIMKALEQQGLVAAEALTRELPDLLPRLPPGIPQPKVMPQPGTPPQDTRTGQTLDYLTIMGLKTNENSPDHSALLQPLDILNNETDETFPSEIEKVLDVDQTLRFLAVSTAIVHLDNYLGSGHNYYLYVIDGKFTARRARTGPQAGIHVCCRRLRTPALPVPP